MVFSARQLLTPVLAPLSRELMPTETRLGLVIAAAALTALVLSWTSPATRHAVTAT